MEFTGFRIPGLKMPGIKMSGLKRPGIKYFYFCLFIIPALFFNVLFFVIPFIRTVQDSFTAREGITSVMPDLQNSFINAEKAKSARFTGFRNFKDVFNPAIDQHFLPSANTRYFFKENYELPFTIDAAVFKQIRAGHIQDKNELIILEQAYHRLDKKKYGLKAEYNEFILFDNLTAVGCMDYDHCVLLPEEIKNAVRTGVSRETVLEKLFAQEGFQELSAEDRMELERILNGYYALFEVKKILGKYLVKKEIMPGVSGFTLLYTGINMVFANLAALLLALVLSRETRFCKVLRSFFFLPGILSAITVSFIWSLLFDKILPAAVGSDIWISSPQLAPLLVALAGVWRSTSCLVLIYLAGLQSIPREYLEAAALTGASAWQQFFQITLPLLLPAITAGIFWSCSTSLQVFDISFGITNASGYAANTVSLVLDIYFTVFPGNRFGYAAAKALLLCLAVTVAAGIRFFLMKMQEKKL